MKKFPKKTCILFLVLDLLACLGLFLTYGPITYFRNLLVTTAMTTMEHHYLARIFYTDEMIDHVLKTNYILESGESTDPSEIEMQPIEEQDVYESIYEEQILKKDPKNDLYKIIPVSGSTYKGYLVVVYDPSRVELALSSKLGVTGELARTIAANNDAAIAINASGFIDINEVGNGGEPTGTVIKDGRVVYNGGPTGGNGGLIGFTEDHVLLLTKDSPKEAIANGMKDAVSFGPFLIVNGEAAKISGNGGWGLAPRTVIAQRQDGIVLFLIIDGRKPGYSIGIDMVETTKLLLRYKAHNAANLDGGASTTLVVDGKLYNRPAGYGSTGERRLPDAWIVK